ncbi:MAG: hypothetical protein C5B43_04405 [Verrucomicrobia bacterium]|nr:MAG: hypothetical protein C5B43_04405 [Verrucomicrobiota bacterium]
MKKISVIMVLNLLIGVFTLNAAYDMDKIEKDLTRLRAYEAWSKNAQDTSKGLSKDQIQLIAKIQKEVKEVKLSLLSDLEQTKGSSGEARSPEGMRSSEMEFLDIQRIVNLLKDEGDQKDLIKAEQSDPIFKGLISKPFQNLGTISRDIKDLQSEIKQEFRKAE